ncbi:MAG: LysR family substrate-binding domain-containing protein [Gammaproteobacteria bacterium]
MHPRSDHQPLRIAVSFGVPWPTLASLLARQRAEEPQVPVRLCEVTLAEQLGGLEDGRYDGGLSLTDAPGSSLSALPLWRDELALAVPARSPLLAFSEVPLAETAQYPLVRWCTQACEPFSRLVDTLLREHASYSQAAYARSYELMAVLVAAGYGVGFGAKSRLAASRKMDIVMRPLAGDRHPLTTYFLRADSRMLAPVDRLIKRAQAIRI